MIELDSLAKVYRGGGGAFAAPVRALDDVSISVSPGTAVGLVGLNGAGKSTLLRLLLGYVRPSAGRATIDDLPPRRFVERNGIAYVPERAAVPGGWTVRGALEAWAALGNVGADTDARVAGALEGFGLLALADRLVRTLSKGNRQRLALAQAFLPDRRVMILDEPTEGLDPVWIARLRERIAAWREEQPERIVLLASHHLAEVEPVCDRVLVLHRGRIRADLERRALEAGSLERHFLELVREWEREEDA